MKVGIQTLPFDNSYGGTLQNYALLEHLKKMGHNPILIYCQLPKRGSYIRLPFAMAHRFFLKYILKKSDISPVIPIWLFKNKKINQEKNFNFFIDKHINSKTQPIYNESDFQKYAPKDCDAYIVGSDQVWRPKFYRFINHAFFDFVENDKAIILSYAASFGTDKWEYKNKDIEKYKKQIKRFKKVSVRENSAVIFCKKYFEVDAELVLDPTLLLDRADYENIPEVNKNAKEKNKILCYFLDSSEEKIRSALIVSEKYNYRPFSIDGEPDFSDCGNIRIFPPISSWINEYITSSFVITDSYHGCIFSIIFNKPFFVWKNEKRGLTRFISLLGMFNLEDRLVYSIKDVIDKLNNNIDWQKINKKLSEKKISSKKFLEDNLGHS